MIVVHMLIGLAALASLVGIVKPFGPLRTRGRAFLCFLGLCLLNGVIAIADADNPNPPHSNTTNAQPAGDANPATGQSNKETSNWRYTSSTDEMTNVSVKVACTTSTNELQFDFPYSGGSTGDLCLRKKGGQLNAWVSISSGQFECGVEDCSLRLKFDDGPIQSFGAEESTTHESNLLFIESASRLLASAKKSKNLKLQADYFQAGSKVLQFDLGSLDTSKL